MNTRITKSYIFCGSLKSGPSHRTKWKKMENLYSFLLRLARKVQFKRRKTENVCRPQCTLEHLIFFFLCWVSHLYLQWTWKLSFFSFWLWFQQGFDSLLDVGSLSSPSDVRFYPGHLVCQSGASSEHVFNYHSPSTHKIRHIWWNQYLFKFKTWYITVYNSYSETNNTAYIEEGMIVWWFLDNRGMSINAAIGDDCNFKFSSIDVVWAFQDHICPQILLCVENVPCFG